VVYVRDAGAAARLPKQIEGHPVVVENLGGPIDALPK
jgi:hypothetical protein